MSRITPTVFRTALLHDRRRSPATDDGLLSIIDQSGWPWLALGRLIRDDLGSDMEELAPLAVDLVTSAPLPLFPVWRGFALDSLVFALGWWALYLSGIAFAALTAP